METGQVSEMPSKRSEQKARRPQEILEAAFETFVEKGYAASRMDDVAARVGITKGTIYLYFPTKEDLFDAVGRQMLTPFTALSGSISRLRGSYTDRIRKTLLLVYDALVRDRIMREMLRLSLAASPRSSEIVERHYVEFIAPLLEAVRTLVNEGVTSGEFSESVVTKTPDVILSSVFHLAVWRLLFDGSKQLNEKAFIEAHIELVVRGLVAATSDADG